MIIYDHPVFAIFSIIFLGIAILNGIATTYSFFSSIVISLYARIRSRKYLIPFKHYPHLSSLSELNIWFEFLDNPDSSYEDIRCKNLGIQNDGSDKNRDIYFKSLSKKDRISLRSLINKTAIYDGGTWGSPHSNSRALYLDHKYKYVDFHIIGQCKKCSLSIDVELQQWKSMGGIQSSIFPKKEIMNILHDSVNIGGKMFKQKECPDKIFLKIKRIIFGQLQDKNVKQSI